MDKQLGGSGATREDIINSNTKYITGGTQKESWEDPCPICMAAELKFFATFVECPECKLFGDASIYSDGKSIRKTLVSQAITADRAKLVERLEKLIGGTPTDEFERAYDSGLLTAISIIKE